MGLRELLGGLPGDRDIGFALCDLGNAISPNQPLVGIGYASPTARQAWS